MWDDIYEQYRKRLPNYREALTMLISVLSGILRSLGYDEFLTAQRVMGRIKTIDSILVKAGIPEVSTIGELESKVSDIVGARVICDYLSQMREIQNALLKHPALRVKSTIDHTEAPRSGGDRAFHLFVELQGVPAEIQIRTVIQQSFVENMYPLMYKFKGAVPSSLVNLLRTLSDILAVADRLTEQIHSEVSTLTPLGTRPKREMRTGVARRITVPYEEDAYVPLKQFEIDLEYFKSLLEKVELTAKSRDSQSKMRSLEELARYLLGCVRCFVVRPKTRTATGELDLYFQVQKIPGTFLVEWGPFVPVECKNWSEPIGVGVIQQAIADAEKMNGKECIIFSTGGVTGNPSFDGIGEVRNQFALKKISLIVLSLSDLQQIATGENLLVLLEEKWRQVRLLA